METLVKHGLQVRDEAVGPDAVFALLLHIQCALHVGDPDGDKGDERCQRENAEEQDEHRVVALHAAVDLRGFVPHASLFIDAQGAEVLKILPAEGGMEIEEERLKPHKQEAFNHLTAANVAKAHDQRGQARPHIAIPEAGEELRKEARLLCLCAACHSKPSFQSMMKWNMIVWRRFADRRTSLEKKIAFSNDVRQIGKGGREEYSPRPRWGTIT